jgi:hypothetical protein
MKHPENQSRLATPNPLKERDPELVANIEAFRSRLGEILLESLAPMFAHPAFRRRHDVPDVLADLHAAAQVLRVLVQDQWSEQDLKTFDTYWRDAMRSDLFGEEFEAEKFRIQSSVQAARTKLLEPVDPVTPSKVKKLTQRTLW